MPVRNVEAVAGTGTRLHTSVSSGWLFDSVCRGELWDSLIR